MKTIMLKGTDATGRIGLVLLPDDATSANDQRGRIVRAPSTARTAEQQSFWLEGYAAGLAVKQIRHVRKLKLNDRVRTATGDGRVEAIRVMPANRRHRIAGRYPAESRMQDLRSLREITVLLDSGDRIIVEHGYSDHGPHNVHLIAE